MADTAITATASAETPKDAARIGTSNDKSWAGWAISSFTNKLATANGEIQPSTGTSKLAETEATRSVSVPRPTQSSHPTQLDLPKKELRAEAQPLGRSLSDQPVSTSITANGTDDVYEAWGAIDDDEEENGLKDDDPFSAPVVTSSPVPKSATVPFDDGGEPDFAGWLAAQSKAKAKKPLPKGLSKPAATTTGTRNSGHTNLFKPKTVVAPTKKIDTKPKDEGEDDGWGDAWD